MSPVDNDKEFEDFLARRSLPVSGIIDRDRTEPPPELDRIVLARAREAIQSPSHQQMYAAPRWALPVALAATLVLSFAVILNFSRADRGSHEVVAAMGAQESQQLAAALEAPQAALPAEAAAPRVMAQNAPAPVATAGAVANALAKQSVPAAPPPPPALAMRADAPAAAATAPEAFGAPGDASLALARESAVESEKALAEASTAADSVVSNQVLAASAADASKAEADSEQPGAAARAKRIDAKAWLRRIEQLRAEGKVAQANQELAQYRQVYPGRSAPAAAVAPGPPSR